MRISPGLSLGLVCGVLMIGGCGESNGEPNYITVQHILIGFKGSVRGKTIDRTREESEKLAREILEQAMSGADFDELVVKYTSDSAPGIYNLANFGESAKTSSPDRSKWVLKRGGMVRGFGDVGFELKVGEIGMTELDNIASPYGWHIIKRLK